MRPDGTATGHTAITWIDTPHFYRNGALIALDVGRTAGLRHAFETVLNPPFAGGGRSFPALCFECARVDTRQRLAPATSGAC